MPMTQSCSFSFQIFKSYILLAKQYAREIQIYKIIVSSMLTISLWVKVIIILTHLIFGTEF